MEQKKALVPVVQLPSQLSLIHSEPQDRQMNQDAITSIVGNMMASLRQKKTELNERGRALIAQKSKLHAALQAACNKFGTKLTKQNRPEIRRVVEALKGLGCKPKVSVIFSSVLEDFDVRHKKIVMLNVGISDNTSAGYSSYNAVSITRQMAVEPPVDALQIRKEYLATNDEYSKLCREIAVIEHKLQELPNNKIMIEGAVASANLNRSAQGQKVLEQATALVSKWLDEKISSPRALTAGK